MSDQFSNTSTKHADPYKEANLDNEASLEQKISDLSNFMTSCKFAMMTTRDAKTGNLVSRCMALAAQVCRIFYAAQPLLVFKSNMIFRSLAASTFFSTPTPSLARLTTLPRTSTSTLASSTLLASGRRSAERPAW